MHHLELTQKSYELKNYKLESTRKMEKSPCPPIDKKWKPNWPQKQFSIIFQKAENSY
jgi:hypothetical protein